MDFIYKKSGTIFNMHSYWTKQPIEPIKYFLDKFTSENDIVLDPFCGTGMTGLAAVIMKRKSIMNDISPVCIHISKGYCTNYEIDKNINKINSYIKNIDLKLEKYFTTKCDKCGDFCKIDFTVVGEVWGDPENDKLEENRAIKILNYEKDFNKKYFFKRNEPFKLCYHCKCSKKKQYKFPSQEDLNNWNNFNYKKYFFPKDKLVGQEVKRNYKRGIHNVYQLYSPRNLTSLSIIFDDITKISEPKIKQLFLFVFTSILFNSSLLSRYREKYENTSIKMGTFYIPPLIKDTNVISNFKNKLKIILKGNKETFDTKNNEDVTYLLESATKLKKIKNDSVDYIYTDPPYSDAISYSELNIVYESWLGERTNNKEEMIVSKYQNKDIESFSREFEKFLIESYRVLKTNKHLTLVFHHPNVDHWRHIQNSIKNSGFKPICENEPTRLVSNSKTSSQHKTQKNTQCFLVFNFIKTKDPYKTEMVKLNNTDFISKVESIKGEAIKKGYLNKSDQFDYIINEVIFKYEIVSNFTV